MTDAEYFKLPDALPFPDRSFRSVTGEMSTLHAVLLAPKLGQSTYQKKTGATNWTPKDKANLVKIFDDRGIDEKVKGQITTLVATSPEEINEYRKRLASAGLLGLDDRPKNKPSILADYGTFKLDCATGDIRHGECFQVIPPTLLKLMNVFLTSPEGKIVTFEELKVAMEYKTNVAVLDAIGALTRILRQLTSVEMFKNEATVGYIFNPRGIFK